MNRDGWIQLPLPGFNKVWVLYFEPLPPIKGCEGVMYRVWKICPDTGRRWCEDLLVCSPESEVFWD